MGHDGVKGYSHFVLKIYPPGDRRNGNVRARPLNNPRCQISLRYERSYRNKVTVIVVSSELKRLRKNDRLLTTNYSQTERSKVRVGS